MPKVLELLQVESQIVAYDKTNFVRLMSFFMEFSRLDQKQNLHRKIPIPTGVGSTLTQDALKYDLMVKLKSDAKVSLLKIGMALIHSPV